MSKKTRLFLMLPVLLALTSTARPLKARGSFSQALFLTGGTAHPGKTVVSAGWEGWIVPCRAFGFYIDFSLRPDDTDSVASMSYGITLRTPGFSDFKPYLMLGFMAARTESKRELYAMPVTLGVEYWITSGIALRAYGRIQVFCRESMYSLQGGLGIRL